MCSLPHARLLPSVYNQATISDRLSGRGGCQDLTKRSKVGAGGKAEQPHWLLLEDLGSSVSKHAVGVGSQLQFQGT